MRNYFALCALVLTVMLSSCGSKKNAAFDGNKSVANPPAITKALEKSATRAYGTATEFDLGFATRLASAAARQELATKIEAVIKSSATIYNKSITQNSTDGNESGTAKDAEGQREEIVKAIVAEIPVNGATIIENNIYKTKDGQYQVFVCVEYQADAMTLAKQMADSYRNYLIQRISNDKRAELDRQVEKAYNELLDEIRLLNGE